MNKNNDRLDKELAKIEEEGDQNNCQNTPEPEIGYTLLSHQELLQLNIPPTQWIMNLMIPNPGLVIISGKPDSYKTFFALWLGLRASIGKPLFDEHDEPYFCQEKSKSPMGKIPTLFIEEENSKQLMKERALGFQHSEAFPIRDLFYIIDGGFKFMEEKWRVELLKIIEEKGIRLLIADPFSSVMSLSNENDNAEVSKVMDIIRKEFVKRGITVILIHHPSKGGGSIQNLRGAGDILGKCDVHLSLDTEKLPPREVKVTYQKLRVADKLKVANFRMRLVGEAEMRDLRFRYLGVAKTQEENRDDLEEKILEVMQDGKEYQRKDVAELVDQKASNDRFSNVWKRLLTDKKIWQNATTKKFYLNS